jgi:organic hydroperoxide reductase OsmC/OhrA
MNTHSYNVGISWEKDRKGLLFSPEVSLPPFDGGFIGVGTPPQFPKGIAGIWSPEHLLTAAVVSCYMTTFLAIAENWKLDFNAFTCNAEGKLEQVEGAWLMTEVILRPRLTISSDDQRERAVRILERSEKNCLISNSVKASVTVLPDVVIDERVSVLDDTQ